MSGVYTFGFNLNNLNNAVLTGVKAMPMKDLNSDSNSSFASDRRAFTNMIADDNVTQEQRVQKKWIGGNRDASDVAARRRVSAVGSSMNPDGNAFAFTSKIEKNTINNALNRVRNQGNCVPTKIANSPYKTNTPAKFWPKRELIRTENRAYLPLDYLGTAVNSG